MITRSRIFLSWRHAQVLHKQECIPVGCAPAHWPYPVVSEGGSADPPSWCRPPGCRNPWMQTPVPVDRRDDTRLWKYFLVGGKHAYCSLADRTCFSGPHQMSLWRSLKWTSLNMSPAGDRARSKGGVPGLMIGWGMGVGVVWGLHSEVQCIKDNGPTCKQTDTSENITILQLRWDNDETNRHHSGGRAHNSDGFVCLH